MTKPFLARRSATDDWPSFTEKSMWWCRGGRTVVFRTLVGPQQELECLVSTTFSYSYSYSSKTGNKGKAAPLQERKMVDKFRVWAKGGDGGNGCCSVRRSRTDWRGKPDGGNGGRGGDVILQCSAAVWDFSNLQHHLNAKKGGHGSSKKMAGSRGREKVVQVPVGTVIHLVSGETPSFLDVTSKKDLQPWEIPDVGEDQQPAADGLVDTIVDDNAKASGLQPNSRTLETKTRYDKLPDIEHTVLTSKQPEMEHTSWSSSPSSEVDKEKEETEYGNEDDDMDSCGTESDEEIVKYDVAELTESGQQLVIAYGGQGGLGNGSLGKGPKHNMKPKLPTESSNPDNIDDESQTSITAGSPGSEAVLILELKSIADIGLVGMPNAGKSTLLGSISRAKPAVGHYAFTTLRPNIGKLNYKDFFSVSVADIPGIIKGAHENRGLGHAFLRHIERTKVLAYVVDLSAALDGKNGISPWEQLRDLVMELEYYQEGLSDRPSLVVANKIDEKGAEDVYEELKRRIQGVPVFPVCAILEEGIPQLKDGLRSLMEGKKSHSLKLDAINVD